MKRIFLILAAAALLSGCADQVSFAEAATHEQVGFWYGLWHGFIVVIAWIISLFDSDVAIYAIYNNGGWYDFGYVLGVMSALGSGGAGGHRRYRRWRTC